MKKELAILTAAVAVVSGVWAETQYANGYIWTYQINGDAAEICQNGSSAAISPSPAGAVAVPAELGGKPVTSIGRNAFYGCGGLTDVTACTASSCTNRPPTTFQ